MHRSLSFETKFIVRNKEMTIAQYFADLSDLWQELDYYQDFQATCIVDTVKFQKLIEKERIYNFLAGLNIDYN